MAPIAVTAFLSVMSVSLVVICLQRKGNSRLLRASIMGLVVYFVGCLVSIFPLIHWHLGIFSLVLMIHNLLSIVFAPRDLTSMHGVFFVQAAALLLIIATVLLGWLGTTASYDGPQSLPRAPKSQYFLRASSALRRYHVCEIPLGSESRRLSIVDVALMEELVSARYEDDFATDFERWFGSGTAQYRGVVKTFPSDGAPWNMYQFTFAAMNTTVLVLSNTCAMSSVVTMVAWLNSLALSPLRIFLPANWPQTIMEVMSVVSKMIGFRWRDTISQVADYLEEQKGQLKSQLIVTARGVAGGIASAAAVYSETPAIIFSAPGIFYQSRSLGFSEDKYHDYVLAVGAMMGVMDTMGGHDATSHQIMYCDGTAKYCVSPQYISYELLQSCGDTEGRGHVPPHR